MWRSLTFAQLNSFTGKVESGQLREMVSWRGRDANSLIYSMSISGNCSLHPTLHVRCCYSTVTAFEQDLTVSWGVQTKSAQSSTRSEYGLLQGVWCHLVRLKKQLPNRWYIIVFHQGIRQKRGWSGESQLYTNLVQPGLVVSSSGIVYHMQLWVKTCASTQILPSDTDKYVHLRQHRQRAVHIAGSA